MDMFAYYFTSPLIYSQIPKQFYFLLLHFLLFNTPPPPSMHSGLPLLPDSKIIITRFKKKSCLPVYSNGADFVFPNSLAPV